MDKLVLEQLAQRFHEIGGECGFSEPVVRLDGTISEIYIVKDHALQLEVDWRENDLFLYVVYLRNRKLPDKSVIYSYPDGHWCRKYIEEVCRTKRKPVRDRKRRYETEYLFDRFDECAQMLRENRERIMEWFAMLDQNL